MTETQIISKWYHIVVVMLCAFLIASSFVCHRNLVDKAVQEVRDSCKTK